MYGGYYPQSNIQYQQLQNFSLKGRPVTSLEEAKASMIDLDGTISYFPDTVNKRIYTKQINPQDGTALLKMYELKEIPQNETPEVKDFVTREEFDEVVKQLKKALAAVNTNPSIAAQF